MITIVKILKTKEEFLRHTFIGVKVFVIEVGKEGYTAKLNEIKETALLYNTLLIKGEDVFEQGKDISDFLKELRQDNPLINIIIETKPLSKPAYMGSLKNITYVVIVESCRIEGNRDRVYTDKTLDWYISADTRFVFRIKDEEDYDNMVVLTGKNNIKKHNIFIKVLNEDFFQYSNWTNSHGYNLFIDYEGSWLGIEEDEEDEEDEEAED